jgi:hypothetical protein
MIAKILVQVECNPAISPDQYAAAVRRVLDVNFPAENWFVVLEERRPGPVTFEIVLGEQGEAQ